MKKLIILTAVIISALTGCKTQQQAGTVTNDDVYASPKYSSKTVQPNHQNIDLSAPQQVASPDSVSRAKSGSATWYDDYSDYSNSSNRQAAPSQIGSSSGSGNSYVDPGVYDNSYSSNPDVNVYMGSSYDPFFWGSSVSIGCGFGWGWDSFYGGYPYPSWYYPYYGYYPYAYGYGGYWNGCWNGYNDGYWDGHHGNPYYNTYSSYYGQRRMLTSGGSGNIHGGSRIVTPGVTPIDQTRGNISSQRISNANGTTATTNRSTDPGRSGINSSTQGKVTPSGRNQADPGAHTGVTPTPADHQHYRFDRSKVNQAPANQRTGTSTTDNRPNSKGDIFSTKDSRTGNHSTGTRTVATQNYSSPAYKQPKYSQEYINPRSQGSRTTGSRESNIQARSSGSDNRGYVGPSSNNRRYSAGYNSNSQRSYNTPSRPSSSSGYSSPSRSYSTPNSGGSRSGGGGSHSSSSRGSSGGSGSTGGGGGGGRRK